MKAGTHQGHCQACGSTQMHTPSGLAKHGYTVKGWGFFAGTCHGSGRKPLEMERTYTDELILNLGAHIRTLTDWVNDYRGGKRIPLAVHTGKMLERGRDPRTNRRIWEEEKIAWSAATPEQQQKEVARMIREMEDDMRRSRQHIEFLTRLAKEVHGKPMRPRIEKPLPRQFTAGEKIVYYGTEYTVIRVQDWGSRQKYLHMQGVVDGRKISPSLQMVRNHLDRVRSRL